MAENQEMAVVVRKAFKYYGSHRDPNKKIILNYLDMNVQRGTIYGLLGSSGCGKTTLLSCVVGRRDLISGDIEVLGNAPAKSLAVRIGYMPQDVALVGEFTVKEAIYFFGRIYGLSEQRLAVRLKELMSLMELPSEDRLVKNMSGGQQRRVSFASVLVHEPELLILDEPTCGLDPVLRDKIWNHLVDIARDRNVAIVITTHYIEETRQANKIGLMRGGELLAEESPEKLMSRFNCETLEEAFLILSIKQSNAQGSHEPEAPVIIDNTDGIDQIELANKARALKNHYDSKDDFTKMHSASTDGLTEVVTNKRDIVSGPERKSKWKNKFKALLSKNLSQFFRQPSGLMFGFIFPIIQCLSFFMAIGHDPRSLDVAIVNDEVPNWEDCLNYKNNSVIYDPESWTCNFTMLSCRYIKSLDDDIIDKKFYSNIEDAIDAVNSGDAVAALHIPYNYSESLAERITDGSATYNGSLENSVAYYYLDMSNHQIGHFFKRKMYKDYKTFMEKLLEDCDIPKAVGNLPVRFEEDVYGDLEAQYTDFMAPGVIMTVLFFVASILTGNIMIGDRLEGIWDRILVAGVKSSEVLLVHIVIQTVVILLMTGETLIIAFAIYDIPVEGNMFTVSALLFMQGLNGMCFGFLVSIICESYMQSLFLSTGAFYPIILLCGIMWPLEGMYTGLRYIAYMMPFTVPIKSLRNVMERGYKITHLDVMSGFGVSFLWLFGFISLCFILLKYKK